MARRPAHVRRSGSASACFDTALGRSPARLGSHLRQPSPAARPDADLGQPGLASHPAHVRQPGGTVARHNANLCRCTHAHLRQPGGTVARHNANLNRLAHAHLRQPGGTVARHNANLNRLAHAHLRQPSSTMARNDANLRRPSGTLARSRARRPGADLRQPGGALIRGGARWAAGALAGGRAHVRRSYGGLAGRHACGREPG